MFISIRIIFICLALTVALASTSVRADITASSSNSTVNPSSPPGENTSAGLGADEIRLRIGPGDPIAGKGKAGMCFSCHGEDGNSKDPQSPKLAGQYGIYIAKQIHNYQTGLLIHKNMNAIASVVSDKELADIAAYFASQPMMRGTSASANRKGQKLFENGDLSKMRVSCNSCHGVTGKGLSPDNPVYPVIGGQHRDYIFMQLRKFRDGARNNSTGGVMNTTVHSLSDADLDALADYISGL